MAFFLRYGASDCMWLSEAEGKALVAAAENKALTAALCCAGTSTLSHVASDHSLQTKAEPEPARDWHMQLPSAYEFVTRGSTSGLTAPIPRTSGPSPRAPHPSPADPAAPPSPTAEPLLPQTEEESHANQIPWGTPTYYPNAAAMKKPPPPPPRTALAAEQPPPPRPTRAPPRPKTIATDCPTLFDGGVGKPTLFDCAALACVGTPTHFRAASCPDAPLFPPLKACPPSHRDKHNNDTAYDKHLHFVLGAPTSSTSSTAAEQADAGDSGVLPGHVYTATQAFRLAPGLKCACKAPPPLAAEQADAGDSGHGVVLPGPLER